MEEKKVTRDKLSRVRVRQSVEGYYLVRMSEEEIQRTVDLVEKDEVGDTTRFRIPLYKILTKRGNQKH